MEPLWSIDLLGSLRARRGERTVTRFPQRSGHLLAYLAYYPDRPHTRERLADTLWPQSDPDVARSNLRVALHALRAQLAPLGDPKRPLVTADGNTVRLDPESYTTDVAQWRRALETARDSPLAQRSERLAAAADRYHDELLSDFYEEWVLSERARLLEQHLEVLADTAAALEETGDLKRALEYARRAVSADPLREEAHYTVMRLLAAIGQPSAVLKQYQELERRLREDLGDTPSARTRALAEELRESARTVVTAAPTSRTPHVEEPDLAAGAGRSGTARNAALPPQFTRFFGRQNEIARVVDSLDAQGVRLVTLTGPGGSGKTRLAIAAAGRLAETFEGTILFVSLADVTEAHRLPNALADALSLPPSPQSDRSEEVVAALGRQRSLLLLDNFEQLLPDGALLLRSFLARVPTLACLVTSRRRLNLAGEQEFVVLPLSTPRRSDPLERLLQFSSVKLFLDRARAVRADFEIGPEEAGVMAELCDRLEGLPLALELAAARMGVLTPRQLLAELGQRFAVLVGRQEDAPRRHQSVRAAIESSYRLLDPRLQRFFARLSVFRGGWTLAAARAVCDTPEALDDLERLRDCSLLAPVEARGGEARYRLLETLREFAWEQLAASGEIAVVRNRHLKWYLALAEQAAAAAYGLEGQKWLGRLEAERENLRAALAWCGETEEAAGDGPELRLAGALVWFWNQRGPAGEGIQALEGALSRSSRLPASLRAQRLSDLAALLSTLGDRERRSGYLQAARQEYEALLEYARSSQEDQEVARLLCSLTSTCFELGDWDEAWHLGLEARERFEALDRPEEDAEVLHTLVRICRRRGDHARARVLLEEGLTLCRKRNLHRVLINVLGALGHLLRDEGEYAVARAHYQESLKIRWELGLLHAVAQSLEDLAVLAGRQGEAERVSRLLGVQAALCESLGSPPPTVNVEAYERTVSESRAALGEAGFARAWAEGQATPLEEAIREALD
jgi:predicted ATPase/DNA-binding SARP family transcriptional activator